MNILFRIPRYLCPKCGAMGNDKIVYNVTQSIVIHYLRCNGSLEVREELDALLIHLERGWFMPKRFEGVAWSQYYLCETCHYPWKKYLILNYRCQVA
jgi:hypothetical protein